MTYKFWATRSSKIVSNLVVVLMPLTLSEASVIIFEISEIKRDVSNEEKREMLASVNRWLELL